MDFVGRWMSPSRLAGHEKIEGLVSFARLLGLEVLSQCTLDEKAKALPLACRPLLGGPEEIVGDVNGSAHDAIIVAQGAS